MWKFLTSAVSVAVPIAAMQTCRAQYYNVTTLRTNVATGASTWAMTKVQALLASITNDQVAVA